MLTTTLRLRMRSRVGFIVVFGCSQSGRQDFIAAQTPWELWPMTLIHRRSGRAQEFYSSAIPTAYHMQDLIAAQ